MKEKRFEELRFNLITESSDTLIFDARDLVIPGKYMFGCSMIWCRQNVYKLFTSSQLWACHDAAERLIEQCEDDTDNPTVTLSWNSGIPISKIVAEILIEK